MMSHAHGFESAIKECIQNNILREYLQRKSREVLSMLLAEYDYDTDIEVRCEEAGKIAFAEGIEKGIAQGLSKGAHQKAIETAGNLLIMGLSIENVVKATGLTSQEVKAINYE